MKLSSSYYPYTPQPKVLCRNAHVVQPTFSGLPPFRKERPFLTALLALTTVFLPSFQPIKAQQPQTQQKVSDWDGAVISAEEAYPIGKNESLSEIKTRYEKMLNTLNADKNPTSQSKKKKSHIELFLSMLSSIHGAGKQVPSDREFGTYLQNLQHQLHLTNQAFDQMEHRYNELKSNTDPKYDDEWNKLNKRWGDARTRFFDLDAKIKNPIARRWLRHQVLSLHAPELEHHWPYNSDILPGVLQQEEQKLYDTPYYNQLCNAMKLSNTLREAHQKVLEEGFQFGIKGTSYFENPTISTSRVRQWDKRVNKPRKVLFVIGDGDPTKYKWENGQWVDKQQAQFIKVKNQMTQMLKEQYHLSDADILVVTHPTHKKVRDAMKVLKAFQQEQKRCCRQPEALVMIMGHASPNGVEDGLPEEMAYLQGGLHGAAKLNYDDASGLPQTGPELTYYERQMKADARNYLGDFNGVTYMFMSCFSGCFTASHDGVKRANADQLVLNWDVESDFSS